MTSKVMSKIKAAFFDRDGTLIRDVGYLSKLDQIELIPQAIKLCQLVQESGYKLFVVTNQSGVARGFFDEAFVKRIHEKLDSLFGACGIHFQKFYYCPHHPEFARIEKYGKKCSCRKPESGMLLQAAEEFDLDLSSSLMFGDKFSDIEAGKALGCKSFLVQEIYMREAQSLKDLIF